MAYQGRLDIEAAVTHFDLLYIKIYRSNVITSFGAYRQRRHRASQASADTLDISMKGAESTLRRRGRGASAKRESNASWRQ